MRDAEGDTEGVGREGSGGGDGAVGAVMKD